MMMKGMGVMNDEIVVFDDVKLLFLICWLVVVRFIVFGSTNVMLFSNK